MPTSPAYSWSGRACPLWGYSAVNSLSPSPDIPPRPVAQTAQALQKDKQGSLHADNLRQGLDRQTSGGP